MEVQNEKQHADTEKKQAAKQPMPAGMSCLACGAVFFILAMILPIYRLWALLVALAIAIAALVVLGARARKADRGDARCDAGTPANRGNLQAAGCRTRSASHATVTDSQR